MNKYYFKSKDDTTCYPLTYFKWLMNFEGWSELTLYEAKRQDAPGYFYCKEYQEPMDKDEGGCGKACENYLPRNGKSGCCIHYSVKFYEPTYKTIVINHE